MSERKYPIGFYRYAFSGEAKCHDCEGKIRRGQYVFVFEGNVYHDICSVKFKGRELLREL